MRRMLPAAIVAAFTLSAFACGGYSSAPGNPNGPTALPPDAIVINIVANNGALSFSPNPATVPTGKTVVWHNVDTITHHVVLDDGELDAGNIGPGAYSPPMGLVAPGPYHCSIHPSMVGRVSGQ